MPSALALLSTTPWYRRWWRRALSLVSNPTPDVLGTDFAQDIGQEPAYDPDSSASAALAFPWPYACVRARGSAMARLPLRVYRWSQQGGREKRAYDGDHWLMSLSERPNSYTSANVFVQETQADLDDDGNSFWLIVGIDADATAAQVKRAAESGSLSLHRIPPKRIKIVPAPWGIKGYEFVDGYGASKVYDPRLVVHVRRASFRDDPHERFRGVGAVRPLDSLLQTEQALAKRDRETASKGRPSVAISPADDKTRWNKEQVADVRAAYESMTRTDGAAFISGGHAKIAPLSFTPRDMATETVRESDRAATLAAYRVPPVMVGLETANYATAREQKAVFWESIQDDAALLSWAWTEILRRAGERDTYAEIDVSGVYELTAWKTDALGRANTLWLMGFDLESALRANGLHEEADTLGAETPTADPEQPRASRALNGSWWARWSGRAAEPAPEGEEARAARWRGIEAQLLAVGERNLGLVMRRFLDAQAERISGALGDIEEPRATSGGFSREDVSAIVDRIFSSSAEAQKLDAASRDEIRRILVRAFEQAQEDVGEDGVTYLSDRIDQLVDQILGDMVKDVTSATKAAVNEIVRRGLAEGQSIADMQAALMQSQAFSPARALRIARTETTRSTGAGSVQAYKQAAPQLFESGIVVKKQWLASRDADVRDAHQALDGQTVAPDQPFVVPAGVEPASVVGESGQAPGGFPSPAMSVNCRCTVIPVVEHVS
jgi:phage portal protein BeeE